MLLAFGVILRGLWAHLPGPSPRVRRGGGGLSRRTPRAQPSTPRAGARSSAAPARGSTPAPHHRMVPQRPSSRPDQARTDDQGHRREPPPRQGDPGRDGQDGAGEVLHRRAGDRVDAGGHEADRDRGQGPLDGHRPGAPLPALPAAGGQPRQESRGPEHGRGGDQGAEGFRPRGSR